MFPSFHDLRQVHVELTTECNAACPMCARNVKGGRRNPLFKVKSLSVTEFSRIITPSVAKQLKKVMLCGNYGDPCMSPSCMGVVQYLQGVNPTLQIGIHTNGGMRDTAWWSDLGKLIQKPSYVRFAIDGLADTNELYRQYVQWDQLMLNVKAFVASGGNAQWDYIVFEHNEHQVDQARDLAKLLGFSNFFMKKTARFFSKSNGELRESYPVHDSNGYVVRELRPPQNVQYQNTAVTEGTSLLIAKHGSMQKYCEGGATIECKAAKDKTVYLTAEGLVFPCCWLASHMYDMIPDRDRQTVHLLENHIPQGLAHIDAANTSTLQQIVDGEFFQKVLPRAWSATADPSQRLRTCALTCGTELQWFEQQCSLTTGERSSAASKDIEDLIASTVSKPSLKRTSARMMSYSPGKAGTLVVLYGSQSGKAESFAKMVERKAPEDRVIVIDLAEYRANEWLGKERAVALIVATYGEGEPTDSARDFYAWLTCRTSSTPITAPCFSVFGLGDRSYKKFNQMAKTVDAKLAILCSEQRRFYPLGLGDASSACCMEEVFDDWLTGMLSSAGKLLQWNESEGRIRCSLKLSFLDIPPAPFPYKKRINTFLEPTSREPAYATLLSVTSMSSRTKHFVFDVSETRISFQAGDHAAILPCNPDAVVADYAATLHLSDDVLNRAISISNASSFHAKVSTRDALKWYVDLCGVPRRAVLRGFAHYCSDMKERDEFLSLTSSSSLHSLRTVVDFLRKFPSCTVPLDYFLDLMPRIAPRYFSVASDPLVHGREMHITVSLIQGGLCSTFLSHLVVGDAVPMFVRRSGFHLPQLTKSLPIVMVGAGTGVAPFIGFLQRRMSWREKGSTLGDALLFFGCRRKEEFLHRSVLEEAERSGDLSLLSVAFSREQLHENGTKLYVHHILQKHAAVVWRLISEHRGMFYICGDARRMARDVEATLVNILKEHGNLTEERAAEILEDLQSQGRYLKDVWTTAS